MTRQEEFIRAHNSFYGMFQPRIIRDKRVRREVQKKLPNEKFYGSWKECTGDIAKVMKQRGGF